MFGGTPLNHRFAPDRKRSAALGLESGTKSTVAFVVACILGPALVLALALTLRARYGFAGPVWSAPLVVIHARDFAFELPDTVPAGIVRIRLVNDGTKPHHAVLTRLADGQTGASYLSAITAWMGGGPFPGPGDDPGGPGLVMPGDSADVVLTLAPGRYLVACYMTSPEGVPHFAKGMSREFEAVTMPGSQPIAPPAADLTVELMDYTFRLSGPLTPGKRWIHVVNRGPQEHELQLARLLPGHTREEALAWLKDRQGPPPLRFEGGLVGISAGRDGYLRRTVVPGDYLLLCFVPDRVDRKPHLAHGMVYAVHVS